MLENISVYAYSIHYTVNKFEENYSGKKSHAFESRTVFNMHTSGGIKKKRMGLADRNRIEWVFEMSKEEWFGNKDVRVLLMLRQEREVSNV